MADAARAVSGGVARPDGDPQRTGDVVLTTPRLSMRQFTEDDLDALFAVFADHYARRFYPQMTERAFAWEKFANAVMPRIPARRWGTGEDFGGIAVYLASDASAYHSGDTFIIDGAYGKF